MSDERPGLTNLLKYLLFTAVIGAVLYFIPQPTEKHNVISYGVSRNPQKAEIKESEQSDESETDTSSITSISEQDEVDNTPLQLPIEEEDDYSEEPINEDNPRVETLPSYAPSQDFSNFENSDDLSDIDYFREFSRIYREQKLKGVQPESRTDVVIRYYQKEKDGEKVFHLRSLGFYIHQRQSSERFDQYASNAIYYGDKVSSEDLKMVAYTLIRQGIDLKTIEPSQFFSDWKAHSIEIGTDDTMENAPSLTISDIRNLSL